LLVWNQSHQLNIHAAKANLIVETISYLNLEHTLVTILGIPYRFLCIRKDS